MVARLSNPRKPANKKYLVSASYVTLTSCRVHGHRPRRSRYRAPGSLHAPSRIRLLHKLFCGNYLWYRSLSMAVCQTKPTNSRYGVVWVGVETPGHSLGVPIQSEASMGDPRVVESGRPATTVESVLC